MHIKLTKFEMVISTILLFAILISLIQIYQSKRVYQKQILQDQASVIYATELLKYYSNERKYKSENFDKIKTKQDLYSQPNLNTLDIIDTQNISKINKLYDKLIVADLNEMEIKLFKSGILVSTYPLLSKGKSGSRWETPAGLYSIAIKKRNHFSSIGKVNMPYSMQFFGNFFIHGWPTYPDGTPVPDGYSGGCLRLGTKDAEEVFKFVELGTKLLIKNNKIDTSKTNKQTVLISKKPIKNISADAYLIADINSGTIYAQKNIDKKRSIASITKLITALTANANIRYSALIPITANTPISTKDYQQIKKGDKIKITDTTYPLLMESNNAVAHAIAGYYGTNNFLNKMRQQIKAIEMDNTQVYDASGISPENKSTARDLFKLAQYLYNNSQFLLSITALNSKTIRSDTTVYSIHNHNHFSNNSNFIGGKTGYTRAAKQTMLTIFKTNINNKEHTIAIIILGSDKRKEDVLSLYNWFTKHAILERINNKIIVKEDRTHIIGPPQINNSDTTQSQNNES